MKLEMVFSATNMFGLSDRFEKWMIRKPAESALYKKAMTAYMSILKKECSEIIGHPFAISALYNAFTEPGCRDFFLNGDKLGFDFLYADSGGLQMVTRGMSVTEEEKIKIYQQQKGADFAFCFDELPAVAVAVNARSNANAKVYQPQRLQECAIATAHNINNQVECLQDSTTKAFYIVQSNDFDSAMKWVSYGMPLIKHPEKLAGFSMAWASLGNGLLEAVETMISFAAIHQKFGQYDRMHLLGVGSISRMVPVLPFMVNGMLPDDITISFDSASLSGGWIYGRLLTADGFVSYDTLPKAEKHLTPIIEEIFPIMAQYMPFDQEATKRLIIGGYRKVFAIINNSMETNEDIAAGLFVVLSSLWQTKNFCRLLMQEYQASNLAHAFANVHTVDEAIQLKDHLIHHLPSKRVKSHQSTLEGFLA